MPREYPDAINCPTCGEPNLCRHCPTYKGCGWYWCLKCQAMISLGEKRPLGKWKVLKQVAWPFPR